ncbi:MAG: DUF2807 domain-containing protein [Treponema sp.]|nr:DUF2807 domain-containing protein [Treponema sp.]
MKRNLISVFRITSAALIVVFLNSCIIVNLFDFNAEAGRGAPETYEFKVGQYNGIKVNSSCDIRYYSAASDTVTLSVQPNLREFYIIEVKNNDLTIRTTKRIRHNSASNPVLTVSAPELNRLIINGACNFISMDKIISDSLEINFTGAGDSRAEIDVKSLSVDISGAGRLLLSGKADSANFDMDGAGEVDALSLLTRETKIKFSGAGALKVNCSEKLSIDADGLGSVAYRGNPSVSLNRNGLVDIKQIY